MSLSTYYLEYGRHIAQLHRRRRNFPFRKQAMPFSQHLENFSTLNKFFSTKLKKKEIM